MSLCGSQPVKAPHCSDGLSPSLTPSALIMQAMTGDIFLQSFLLHTETSSWIVSFNLGVCFRVISLSRNTGRKVILPSCQHECFNLAIVSFIHSAFDHVFVYM